MSNTNRKSLKRTLRSFAREAAPATAPTAEVDEGLAALIKGALDERDRRTRETFKSTLATLTQPDRGIADAVAETPPASAGEVRTIVSRYQPLDVVYARLYRHNERLKFSRSADLDHFNLEWFKAMVDKDRAGMMVARDKSNDIYKARATLLGGALDASDPTAVLAGGAGSFMPQAFTDAVQIARTAAAVIENLSMNYTMTSATLRLPTSGVATAYKTAEGVAPTQGEPTISNVMLRAEKNSVLMFLSRQAMRDGAANFMTTLTETSGRALALSQDTDLATSNGTHPNCTAKIDGGDISEASSGVLTMPDVLKLYRGVGKAYRGAGCAWLADGPMLTFLDAIDDGNGRPLLNNQFNPVTPIGDSPGNEGMIFRHPVYECPIPSGVLIFGNIRAGYAVGRRAGVEMRTSDGPGFDAGLIHLLVEEEYDAAIQDAVAIKKLSGITSST